MTGARELRAGANASRLAIVLANAVADAITRRNGVRAVVRLPVRPHPRRRLRSRPPSGTMRPDLSMVSDGQESDPRPRLSDRLADVGAGRTRQDSRHEQVRGPGPDPQVRRLRARIRIYGGGAALPSWHGIRRSIALCGLPGESTDPLSPRTPTTALEPRGVRHRRARGFPRPAWENARPTEMRALIVASTATTALPGRHAHAGPMMPAQATSETGEWTPRN
jgi:hypothetical protein